MFWLVLAAAVDGPGAWSAPPLVTLDGEVWPVRNAAPISVRQTPPPPRPPPEVPPSDTPASDAVEEAVGEAAAPSVASAAQGAARPSTRQQPWLGVQVDLGFPDGVGASVMVMPFEWLRAQVGASWNGASRGVRAALVGLLFPSVFKAVRPTLSLEGGYAFDTDSAWLVTLVSDSALKGALSRVDVLHGGGHVGLEFGSKYFSLFVRGGLSYVDVKLGEYTGDGAAVRGLALHGVFPTGKLGVLVCFL